MSMRHSSKVRLNDQKKINDEMIKHDHENKSFQTIFAKNKFESHFLNYISHFETERKTRYQHILAATHLNIYSRQIFIWRSSLICIHRNSDSFTSSSRAKKEDYCERKSL
jgi:hypothetical protein